MLSEGGIDNLLNVDLSDIESGDGDGASGSGAAEMLSSDADLGDLELPGTVAGEEDEAFVDASSGDISEICDMFNATFALDSDDDVDDVDDVDDDVGDEDDEDADYSDCFDQTGIDLDVTSGPQVVSEPVMVMPVKVIDAGRQVCMDTCHPTMTRRGNAARMIDRVRLESGKMLSVVVIVMEAAVTAFYTKRLARVT